jgi:hypothetical protein
MSYNFSNAAMQFNGGITAGGEIRAKNENLSGSTITIGSAELTAAELEVLDVNGGSALAGSAQASKALVVDASRDIANINALTAGAIVGSSLSASAGVSGFNFDAEGTVDALAGFGVGGTEIVSSTRQLMNIASLDATSEATIESAIDTLANLGSMGTADNELEALGSLDVAQGLKIANMSFVTPLRGIENLTTISGSGAAEFLTLEIGAANSLFNVAATGKLTTSVVADLDGGIDVNASKFTVSSAGAVVAESSISGAAGNFHAIGGHSLALQSGGITAAGAIAGATTIDASGDLTVGSITNAEFTVDASGNTDIDGTLNVEGVPTFQAGAVFSAGITTAGAIAGATTISGSGVISGLSLDIEKGADLNAGGITNAGAIAGATSVDGSGDLTMGTITMTGFTVDADGDVALKSLAIDDGSTIGPDSVTDLITMTSDGDITIKDGAYDFDIAAHDGTNGLKLAGTLVTATAAELNTVDVTTPGIAQGGKAAIFDDNKDFTGFRNLFGDSNNSRVMISGSNGSIDLRQKSDCPRLDIMLAENLKIRLSGSGDASFTGEVECGSVKIDDGSTIGPDSIKDLITLAGAGDITIKDGAYDFDIASHDATNGLKLAGTLVTAGAAELNELTGFGDAAMANSHSIVFDNGSSLKSESFADFSALLAGAGLTVNGTTKKLEVTSNAMATFSGAHDAVEGYNVYTGNTNVTVTMPSDADDGDLVIIKAMTLQSGQKITINKHGSHNKQMDGADTIKLELSFAAVNLVYINDTHGWAIV